MTDTPDEIPLKIRNPLARGPRERGKISEGRDAWVTLKPFEIVLLVGDEPAWLEKRGVAPYEHPRHKVEFRFPSGKRSWKFDLTSMTANEIKALAAFWKYALAKALPIAEILDEEAQVGFEKGDDTYIRLYRPDPIIYCRADKNGKKVAIPLEYSDLDWLRE